MSNEELQALIDIISKLTDGTVTAVIWILAAKYGSVLIGQLMICLTVLAIALILLRLVQRISIANSSLRAIRDMLGIGAQGILSDGEIREVLQRVSTLQQKGA